MEGKIPISVLYLGRRGGGAKITKEITEELGISNSFFVVSICIRSDNELAKTYDQSKIFSLFKGLVSISTILKIIRYSLNPKKLLTEMQLSSESFCLVPMISPLGYLIEAILRRQGVTVIRLLHDFEKHPGDKWPPSFLIRQIVKRSNFLIVLSNGVASRVKEINPQIKLAIYPHPVFDFTDSWDELVITKKYLLFIGRIRKYKGVDNLIAAFKSMKVNEFQLVIAGEGKLKYEKDSRLISINRWLKESEIVALIKNSEAVVFPYIEASQSGLLPYCVSENKKVVVTPLPGLLEQIEGYKNAFITKDFDLKSLSYAIRTAISAETKSRNNETPITVNIESCLLESGLFTKK